MKLFLQSHLMSLQVHTGFFVHLVYFVHLSKKKIYVKMSRLTTLMMNYLYQ